MRIEAGSRYRSEIFGREIDVQEGDVIDVTEAEFELIVRDSPGTFAAIDEDGGGGLAAQPAAVIVGDATETDDGVMTTESVAFVPDEKKAERRAERKAKKGRRG